MAATLFLGVAAVNTGNNLLFLTVSAMLSFMAVTGLLGWLNIRHLRVSLRFPDEIYAGRETLVGIEVANRKKRLPSFLITASICGRESAFTLIEAGKGESGTFVTSFSARGPQQVTPPVLSSPFPVNFFLRYSRAPVTARITVFPAPRPGTGFSPPGKDDSAHASFFRGRGYEGDLVKINDYRGGEALKLIHWRLSAKHEVFKVKELTTTAEEPVILEVEHLPGLDLEERLGLGAFLVNTLIKRGRAVGLKVGERVIAPAAHRSHRLKLLGELASYGKN